MGWMDKAKKLADQAQTKLDEVQKQFNETQGSTGSNPAPNAPPPVEYDQHGRPVAKDPSPPHGDPLAAAPPPPPPPAEKGPQVAPEPPAAAPGQGDPLGHEVAEHKPPKPPEGGGLTSGDPLAG
jgi:hypothetical protein